MPKKHTHSVPLQLLLLFSKSQLMKKFLLFSSVLLAPLAITPALSAQETVESPRYSQPLVIAQDAVKADPFFLTRAKNLARQAAERENGGLSQYRAETSMYGPAIDSPHVENEDGSVTFSFKGGAPGFVSPTLETVATVSPAGIVTIGYNGPIRPAAAQPPQPEPTPAATDPIPQVPSQIIDQIKDLVE
ncbi:hypothetical protein ON05_015980 [Acaryochloris sp. CCMEE 5410]|nr:hypothetical protein ON05_015980 [Acaryochloris sp. CCMEE 5410]